MIATWQPGATIGPYQLERLLGRGGVGEVWLARDTRLDRTVAIKALGLVQEDDQSAIRFGREARNLARLNHPSIVHVYDVGQLDGRLYIVTEFVDGPNLEALIRIGQIRVTATCR
jgi:serine/threonine protein kinase